MPRKKAVEAGYNEMGQPVDAPKGEVSIEAVKEFQEALPEPMPREPKADTGNEEYDKFLELLKDPTFRNAAGMDIAPGLPLGEYKRDYDSEDALKVYGGVEVKQGPDF